MGEPNGSFMDQTIEEPNISSEEDEFEEFTAQQVLSRLEQSWMNEKLSPDILPHKFEMVECMLTQLHHMERNLLKLPKGDLRIMLHQMEIDRIKYIVTSYVRTRLKKIETFATSLSTQPRSEILSNDEQQYLTNYMESIEKLFKSNVINHLNQFARRLDWSQMTVEPNINSRVFVQVVKDRPAVELDDDEIVDLQKDDRYFVNYKFVKELMLNDVVQLI